MKLRINQFAGELPIVAKSLLPENAASETLNARMEGGSLVPVHAMSDTVFVTNSFDRSFYLSPDNKVFSRFDFAMYTRGPIANDQYDRVYAGGDLHKPELQWDDNGTVKDELLGIQKPGKPAVIPTADSLGEDDQEVYAAYFVTAVTSRGEESEPSDATDVFVRWDGSSSQVAFAARNDSRAAAYRIYRTEGGGEYNFVAEVVAADSTPNYVDSVPSDSLGSPCESENYNHPPDKLENLISIGNGVLAGFMGNALYFCEPYRPHAWPLEYQLAFPDEIMGIGTMNGSVAVMTKGRPWIVSGSHPAAMSQYQIDNSSACVSKRSVVDMGGFVLYASAEGLISVSGNGMTVATKNVFSKTQWNALQPEKMFGVKYRDQYLCFTGSQAFIFDMKYGVFPIDILTDSATEILSAHYSSQSDQLYFLVKHSDDTTSIKTFDTGDALPMSWTSREFVLSASDVFSCARVDSDANYTFRLFSDDGSYDFSVSLSEAVGFRLPPGRPRRVKVTVSSTARINELSLASNMGDLI